MVRAIVGANWGDEGKGKITDMLAENSDIVIRFQGGANAGHTIINNFGKFALHLLPSGACHSHVLNVIGPGVALDIEALLAEIKTLTDLGFDKLPVCIAKTQYSFSDDPTKLGAPENFEVTIKPVRVSAGAGFVVVLTGDIMTMPGLPKHPAAENIDVDADGRISGLF